MTQETISTNCEYIHFKKAPLKPDVDFITFEPHDFDLGFFNACDGISSCISGNTSVY